MGNVTAVTAKSVLRQSLALLALSDLVIVSDCVQQANIWLEQLHEASHKLQADLIVSDFEASATSLGHELCLSGLCHSLILILSCRSPIWPV